LPAGAGTDAKETEMKSSVRRAAFLAVAVLLVGASAALAASVKAGAIKGAKYTGTVRSEPVTITVSSNGRSAKAAIPFPPAYCQGGGGGEVQHTKPAAISKGGSFAAKIAYTVMGTSRQFATVTIKGTFIGKDFDGVATSSFTPAVSCNGHESFFAQVAGK
jgi:hypothetical protein